MNENDCVIELELAGVVESERELKFNPINQQQKNTQTATTQPHKHTNKEGERSTGGGSAHELLEKKR